jgi:hypothetical protein
MLVVAEGLGEVPEHVFSNDTHGNGAGRELQRGQLDALRPRRAVRPVEVELDRCPFDLGGDATRLECRLDDGDDRDLGHGRVGIVTSPAPSARADPQPAETAMARSTARVDLDDATASSDRPS